MALLADRVKETSTTTGTGALTLAGAVTGFQSFASAFADADEVFYVIVAVNASGVATGAWEVGIGTVGSGGTQLARDVSVYASSNAGALVNFGAGTKQVFVDRPADGLLPIIVPNGDPLALNAALDQVIRLNPVGTLVLGAGNVVLANAFVATMDPDQLAIDDNSLEIQGTTGASPVRIEAFSFFNADVSIDVIAQGAGTINLTAPVVASSTVTATDFIASGYTRVTPVTVATLNATPVAGMIQSVSDAISPQWGVTLVGGGDEYALVSYGADAWRVIGV